MSVPSGVEEAVMLDTGAEEPMLTEARGEVVEPFAVGEESESGS